MRVFHSILVLLALACVLTAVPLAVASEAPLQMTTANRARAEVIKLAMREPAMTEALEVRPRSKTVTKFNVKKGEWTVAIREEGGGRDLARVKVDDRTGTLTGRYSLPFAEYPPRLTSRLSERVAYESKAARREAKEWGGIAAMSFDSSLDSEGQTWEVNLRDKQGVIRVRVDVLDANNEVTGVWTGHQIAWEMLRGERMAFGTKINEPWAWWPLFVAFGVVLIFGIGVRGWDLVDGLALLSFGISYEAFVRGEIAWSVPLAIPPLVWLGLRMAYRFTNGVPPAAQLDSTDEKQARRPWVLPTWLILLVAVLAIGMRWGVGAWGSNIIDVGYAGVAGASSMLDGKSPYGNMPEDNQHGDTYGPLNYAIYVPAVVALGDGNLEWGQSMPAARAVSIFSDALCILGMLFLGFRWMGKRGGVLLAAGWATYPFTAMSLASHVNDLLVAAGLIWALVFIERPFVRGLLVGASASIKFVPLLALPALAHVGGVRRLRQFVWVGAGVLTIVAVDAVLLASFPGGFNRFLDATFGFQVGRQSPFSPWGLYGWRNAQLMLQGALLATLALMFFRPKIRDARQAAAGMGAALIGVQLVLQHWFYLYLPWFLPFVLVVLVARTQLLAQPLVAAHSSVDELDAAPTPP